MTDINSLVLIGRLTRDPEALAYTANGTARLNLTIAVNRSEKHGGEWSDRASFLDVTVWGKQAENIHRHLNKGKQIAVSGYLEQQRWEKDGKKYSKVVIIADSVQLLGGKSESAQNQAEGYRDGEQEDFPEDIPF